MKDYEQINKALQDYEHGKCWHDKSNEWIYNWCCEWEKIPEEQKNELVDRICKVMENERKGETS